MDGRKYPSLEKRRPKVMFCVPQGSVFGPFVFLLYLNGLENVIKNIKSVMFIDDTTVVSSGKELICSFLLTCTCFQTRLLLMRYLIMSIDANQFDSDLESSNTSLCCIKGCLTEVLGSN